MYYRLTLRNVLIGSEGGLQFRVNQMFESESLEAAKTAADRFLAKWPNPEAEITITNINDDYASSGGFE